MSDLEDPAPDAALVDLLKLYRRPSAVFAGDDFDTSNPLWSSIRVLVVGAGGLGCELLHTLALTGFTDLEVIDMDRIELSNLNRQFLFREQDVGLPKAEVAAAFVKARCPHVSIRAHFGCIESKPNDFYETFHMIIMGLDSVYARRWMNAKVAEIATREVDAEGLYRITASIPIIDGGTEGYKGSIRLIQLGQSACIECALWMYPPVKTVPMCTLENIPRFPEHCVLYVKEKVWQDDRGCAGESLDPDNAEHIVWVMQRAQERQALFGIQGTIDFAFTLGVVKNVVPAVGFTNAFVAGCCVLEALKLATAVARPLHNYAFYNGAADGIASQTSFLAAMNDCPVCGTAPSLVASFDVTAQDFLGLVLAALPLNGVWKLERGPGADNDGAALKVFVDGPTAKPVYVKYARGNPLALTDEVVQPSRTIAQILVAKRPLADCTKGFLFEATNNNLIIRFFVAPQAK